MLQKNINTLRAGQVKLAFTNKVMTAYGGFAIISKLFEKFEFHKHVEEMIPFQEISPNSTGVYAKVLRFGLTVLSGGRRFSHTMFLGDSTEIYEKVFSIKRLNKSISSVTRFFNRIRSWNAVEKLAEKLWQYTVERIIPWGRIKSDYLTLDSTVITRYGAQEGALVGYNPKKRGRASHHPLIAFLNRSQFIVNLWNRSGNAAASNNCVEFAKQTIERLKGKLTISGVLADSSFYTESFLKFIEGQKLFYTVAVTLYSVIQQLIYNITDWIDIDDTISVSEFGYRHKNWDKFRRYIVVRQKVIPPKKPSGKQLTLFEDEPVATIYRYGCFVTSHMESPEVIWRLYRLRVSDEGVIRENKYDFGLDGFSLSNFYSVEACMLIRILFYNIIQSFRLQILPESEEGQTLHTLRMKYLLIPAVLGRNGKEIILRLGIRTKKLRQKIRWIFEMIDIYITNRVAVGSCM